MEQAERQQEVEKLQSRVQQLQAEHQQEVQKLGAEVEKMNKLDAEAKRLADENNDMDLKIDELTHDKGVFQVRPTPSSMMKCCLRIASGPAVAVVLSL